MSQFAKHKGTGDGLSRDCKTCEATRLRAYRRKKANSSACEVRELRQGEMSFE